MFVIEDEVDQSYLQLYLNTWHLKGRNRDGNIPGATEIVAQKDFPVNQGPAISELPVPLDM